MSEVLSDQETLKDGRIPLLNLAIIDIVTSLPPPQTKTYLQIYTAFIKEKYLADIHSTTSFINFEMLPTKANPCREEAAAVTESAMCHSSEQLGYLRFHTQLILD